MCLIAPICFPCFSSFFNRLGFEITGHTDSRETTGGQSTETRTGQGLTCCRRKMSCTFSRKNQIEDVGWRESNQQERKHKTQDQPVPAKTMRVQQKPGPSHPSEKLPGPVNGKNSSKTCCFCWCCCCSCSCISIQDREESQGRPSEDLTNDPITFDEIQTWGKSFEKLLKNKKGQEVFRQFLRSEFSEENVLFWIACENLKFQTPADYVEEQARNIYEDYISIFSPKEVSLDSEVRELIDRNMVNPTRNTFDEAQIQIFTLMQRDSYPRFVSSNLYKQLLTSSQPSTSSQQQPGAAAVSNTLQPPPAIQNAASSSEVAKVFSNFSASTAAVSASRATTTTNNVRVVCSASNGSQSTIQTTVDHGSKEENLTVLKQEPTSSTKPITSTSSKINNQVVLSASSALEQLQQQNSVEINYLTSGPEPSTEERKAGFEHQDSGTSDLDRATNGSFNIPGATVLASLTTAINT